MITVEHASNPRFNHDGTIDLDIKFAHLDEIVPFTASASDPVAHGREIFSNATAGQYGPIAAYAPPPPEQLNPPARRRAMMLAIETAQHFDMMGETEQAAAWRGYYRELHALEQAPEWPLVTQWPVAPESAA